MHGYPQFSFQISKAVARPLSHTLRKNIFVLVGIFLTKLEVLGTSQDAQNICTVEKGGTVL